MPDATSFLQELDDAIAKGSAESRLRALWHATDLLIAGRYSDSEIWIFGEIIGRLAEEIEVVARARLAKRLAHANNAPKSVVGKLALDDSIDVAEPVLHIASGSMPRSWLPISGPRAKTIFWLSQNGKH
jgi:uncharacterized protein (DUF2336 family)